MLKSKHYYAEKKRHVSYYYNYYYYYYHYYYNYYNITPRTANYHLHILLIILLTFFLSSIPFVTHSSSLPPRPLFFKVTLHYLQWTFSSLHKILFHLLLPLILFHTPLSPPLHASPPPFLSAPSFLPSPLSVPFNLFKGRWG